MHRGVVEGHMLGCERQELSWISDKHLRTGASAVAGRPVRKGSRIHVPRGRGSNHRWGCFTTPHFEVHCTSVHPRGQGAQCAGGFRQAQQGSCHHDRCHRPTCVRDCGDGSQGCEKVCQHDLRTFEARLGARNYFLLTVPGAQGLADHVNRVSTNPLALVSMPWARPNTYHHTSNLGSQPNLWAEQWEPGRNGDGPPWQGGGNGKHGECAPHTLDRTSSQDNIREQLQLQCITQLMARRPRQFAGMDYATSRVLIQGCVQHFKSKQEKSLMRCHAMPCHAM